MKKVGPSITFSWITFYCQVFSQDMYYFSESLGYKLVENYEGFKKSSLFFQRIVKQSKKVRHLTCLETNFILIPNFPQISTKYAPKNQKRTKFHEFKQFWWIWSFMPMSIGNNKNGALKFSLSESFFLSHWKTNRFWENFHLL
jgi:hypothetical protein